MWQREQKQQKGRDDGLQGMGKKESNGLLVGRGFMALGGEPQ